MDHTIRIAFANEVLSETRQEVVGVWVVVVVVVQQTDPCGLKAGQRGRSIRSDLHFETEQVWHCKRQHKATTRETQYNKYSKMASIVTIQNLPNREIYSKCHIPSGMT